MSGLTKAKQLRDNTFDATQVLAKFAANSFTNANVDSLFATGAIDAGKLNFGNGLKDVSDVLQVEPNDIAGAGLEDDGADNLRISTAAAGTGLTGGGGAALAIDTATGTVTFTAGTWTFPVDVLQVTGTPNTANDAVNKAYVDSLVSGITWKEPVTVFQMIGENTIAAINALTPATGDSVVASDAGTPSAGTSDALAAGDIAEFDGTSWKLIVTNAAGRVPNGIRVVVSTTQTLTSPFTASTDEGRVVVSVSDPGTFNGVVSDWNDEAEAVDGNAILIQGPETNTAESVNENNGYVFDGAVPTGTWIQFTGAGNINAGQGLTKSGNTLNVGAGNGITVNADDVEVIYETVGNITTVNAGDAAAAGVNNTAARGDHQHAVATATPGSIQPDDAAAEGVSTSLARADHTHAIVAAAPTTNLTATTTNAEGVATSFARSDHTHAIDTGTPSNVGTANAVGTASALARADHIHNSPELTTDDKTLNPSATTGDAQDSGIDITNTPALDGHVQVFINGIGPYDLADGDGERTTAECYFSVDGGTTARAISAITAGDSLFWNGVVAGFDLETDDEVDLVYMAF